MRQLFHDGPAVTAPLVCAHRGASLSLADNSLEAFTAAIELGADFVETDVRRAPDGTLVLAHDDWDIVPGIVTLAQLLQLARGRIGLDLEIAEPGYEAEMTAAIAGWRGPIVVTSIHPQVLETVHRLGAGLATGYVHENFYDGDPLEIADSCGASIALVEHDVITPALLDRVVRESRTLWAWTVNDASRLTELIGAAGIAAVITDDPGLACEVRTTVTNLR